MQYIGQPPVNSNLYKWNEIVGAVGEKTGRPWTNVQYYKSWMEEAGFEDVVEKRFYWPISPWAKGELLKTIGLYFQEDLLDVIEPLSLKTMGLMGWSTEEIHAFLVGLREDIKDTSLHAYMPM
jgi:hypothetical protein